jgi:hypothetical protein
MNRRRTSLAPASRAWIVVACLLCASVSIQAQTITARDQARRIYDRLAGTPPDVDQLGALEELVEVEGPLAAAEAAMEQRSFYTVVLRNFITPWTNQERTVFADLNDYTATVIGIIRDERDFREVLTGDILYVGDSTNPAVANVGYSHTSNEHYRQLGANRVDLSDETLFFRTEQSTRPGAQIASEDTAGVLTTRAAGMAFFSAGTNRRMLRFTAINHLCRDLEELKDVSRPADRIRQDISRSPGGDSALFHQQCVGCHSGMDPLAGAFAYFEWDADAGRVVYTDGQVQGKHLINANTFPGGYITVDDRWDNFWRSGPNAALGWRGPETGGYGIKGFGREVAESRAFAVCQTQKVFEQVCFRPPRDSDDATAIETIATAFEDSGYRMKTVFAQVAVYCMGE